MKSKLQELSNQYISLIEDGFEIGYSGNLSRGAEEIEVHWSPQHEITFSSRCRELFYYSVNDIIDEFCILSQKPGSLNALHYGPIGEEIDKYGNRAPQSPIEVASQALLMADTIILQDLIYRICSSSSQLGYSIDERRNYIIQLLIETIKLKPLIDRGFLAFIPWFPQWSTDFASAIESLSLTFKTQNDETGLISNVLSVATAINGVPFTTYQPASLLMTDYLKTVDKINTEKDLRYFQILDFILKDEYFSYILSSCPEDIIETSKSYSSFRDRLRFHFKDLISSDFREFQLNLPGAVEDLKDKIDSAKKKLSKRTWSRYTTLTSSGVGSILAVSGITAEGIIQQGLIAGASLAALKPLKDLFEWVKVRYSPEEHTNLLCQALIDLENRQKRKSRDISVTQINDYM